MLMFDADKPIQHSYQDSLGRLAFVQPIAKAILEYRESKSLVIGVYGRWGSGKSSTMNLLKEAIEDISKEKDNKPIVIIYSAWGSHSLKDLFVLFCESLQEVLIRFYKQKRMSKNILKKISKYANAISNLSIEAGVAGKIMGLFLEHETSASELKKEIEDQLKMQERKIVVIIDDIDRLPDEQIRNVFQFVNNVADFSNVTYVLPIDHDEVAAALSGVQGFDGSAYMGKIIQVPLSLPDPEDGYLLRIIEEELGYLIDVERDDFNQNRLAQITEYYLLPNVRTPRDVRRLQNVFRFQNEVYGSELNTIDLLALSALLAFEPWFYGWIKNNQDILIGKTFQFEKPKDRNGKLEKSLAAQGFEDYEIEDIKERLRFLFPALSGESQKSTFWRERRLCHPDLFGLYFSCPNPSRLPSWAIRNSLIKGDIHSLEHSAFEAKKNGIFRLFLDEIECRLEVVPQEVKPELAKMLLSNLGCDSSDLRHGIFYFSSDQLIAHMVKTLYLSIGPQKTQDVILSVVPSMNAAAIAAFAYELNSEELAHGRLASNEEDGSKQVLLIDGLPAVEQTYIDRVKSLAAYDDDFMHTDDMAMLMHLWTSFDLESCKRYWKNLIDNTPECVCYLINSVAQPWSSSNGNKGFSFSKEVLEKVLPREEILQVLDTVKGLPSLESISNEILIKTIIFYQDGYKDLSHFDRMTVKEAVKLIPDWRKGRQS